MVLRYVSSQCVHSTVQPAAWFALSWKSIKGRYFASDVVANGMWL